MTDERLKKWANRRASGKGVAGPIPQAPPTPQAPTHDPPALPPAPPGYVHAWRPDVGAYVLVPVATSSVIAAPHQAWSGVQPRPYASQTANASGPDVESCMIVKPGNIDPYADMMAQLPQLYPDLTGGADAMTGNWSSQTSQELGNTTSRLSSETGHAVILGDIDYSNRGGVRPLATSTPALGSVPLPPLPVEAKEES